MLVTVCSCREVICCCCNILSFLPSIAVCPYSRVFLVFIASIFSISTAFYLLLAFDYLFLLLVKGKGSSLDIAPLTILDSGALQPRKWQLTGIDCSTTAQASGCP